jgi:hypothetical protein
MCMHKPTALKQYPEWIQLSLQEIENGILCDAAHGLQHGVLYFHNIIVSWNMYKCNFISAHNASMPLPAAVFKLPIINRDMKVH